MKYFNPIFLLLFVLAAVLSGCQSNIPPQIRQSLEQAPSLEQVRQQADGFIAQNVRWGGLILGTENRENTSRLTIMALPLNDDGKPSQYDKSPGRFIAVVDQFLEPLEYARDRKITFIGTILGTETQKVGEFPYDYPVIQADQHYLWPKTLPVQRYPGYWYDPWYYPAWPYWNYPYRPYPIRLQPNTIKR